MAKWVPPLLVAILASSCASGPFTIDLASLSRMAAKEKSSNAEQVTTAAVRSGERDTRGHRNNEDPNPDKGCDSSAHTKGKPHDCLGGKAEDDAPATPAETRSPFPTPSPTPTPQQDENATSEASATEALSPFVHEFVRADENDPYIFAKDNVKLYRENWGRSFDPLSYWGPAIANQDCYLTYRYALPAPVKSASLYVESFTWNHTDFGGGQGWGSSTVSVSVDGSIWQDVLDNSKPTTKEISEIKRTIDLSERLKGTEEVYVRIKLFSTYVGAYTNAQVSRVDATKGTPSYNMNISF